MYVDVSSNAMGSWDGFLLKFLSYYVVEHSLCFGFLASNNEKKYETLIASLNLAWQFGATSLKISSDSHLVVNHVNGLYVAKCLNMTIYLKKVKELMQNYEKVDLKHLPRKDNSPAGTLTNIAFTNHLAGKRTSPIEYFLDKVIRRKHMWYGQGGIAKLSEEITDLHCGCVLSTK